MFRRLSIFLMFFVILQSTAAQNPRTVVEITARETTVTGYVDKEINISGKSDLKITAATCAASLNNSIIRLNSEDSWIIFENLRPTVVIDSLLKFVFVNNVAAVNKTNVRVAIYAHGTVVIPHTPQIRPLSVWTDKNFSGNTATYPLFTYHNGLSTMDNKIRSFKLKRGYMATLANNADGSGYSRVFIADKEDIEFSELTYLLDETVSFIRVFPWEYVSKKGWCGTGSGGGPDTERVKGTWWYSWSADQNSRQNQEYVTIKQNLGWPGWAEINGKQNVTHLLGFNEPDRPDQSNMTVAQALAAWPEYMKSGLRIGTPATASPNAWLYEFVDSCKARNWRIDYLAVHCYWGGKSPQNWYNDLRYVHQRTGLPIWITEWNNGANWTTENWPTADRSLSPANATKQLNDLKAILNVLDTASFIERYSIYNWVQDARAMILSGDFRVTANASTGKNDTVFLQNGLTPAGVYYMNNKSRMAFDRRYEVIPTWRLLRNPGLSLSYGTSTIAVNVNDQNGDYFRGFILEKKVGNGNFEVILNSDDRSVKTYSDVLDITGGPVKYRVRTKLVDGTLSNYSPEVGMDITSGDKNVQFGKINLSSTEWSSVFFNQPFDEIPSIVLGAPSNNNVNALISPRVKFVSRTTRFQIQASTWSYLNLNAFSKDESVPYLLMKSGEQQFGDVKAFSGRATANANWTTVTFPTPFDVVPVVFVNQLIAATTYATVVRIKNVTTTGFQVKIFKEEGVSSTPGTETISYIAITPGKGNIEGRKFVVGKTADNFVTTSAKQILFGDTIYNPVFIAQMQTCNDEVTAALRSFYEYERGAFVFKQRERSVSSTTTAVEGAGWIALDPVSVIQSVDRIQEPVLSFSPNPVTDRIILHHFKPFDEKTDIYSFSGVLVKSVVPEGNSIDVSDLPSGYYLIRTKTFSHAKFIKL